MYFIASGGLLFGLLLGIFLLISEDFAELALLNSLEGMTEEMASSLYVTDSGKISLDDSEVKLKWGFDALYSNLGYRLVTENSAVIAHKSAGNQVEGAIINKVPLTIPMGFSRDSSGKISLYRVKIRLNKHRYFFDVARSDLLEELANEAVKPAIIDVSTALVCVAFVLFLILNFIAIRLIVRPARSLTKQIENIKPDDLEKRIDVTEVPKELISIANAMNEALNRVEQGFEQQQRFVADAAHELRTPLAIFLNRLELKIPPSDDKSDLLNDAHYISRIVEQLLDLSRAQNLRTGTERQIRLLDVARSMGALLAPLAIDKGQELELVEEGEAGKVLADEGAIAVVIKNLLENAIRHTGAGTRIRLTTGARAFTIEDSGRGISESIQTLIFQRFWRKNQSDREGSGLGLAIAAELLSHYNVSISVSNSPALGGAKFHFCFSDDKQN